jgi:O-antigen ligase
MCAAKKKTRLPKKKDYPKHKARSARTPNRPRLEEKTWGPSFESCIGWFVCLSIVIAPLVFNSHIRNFADLPQRTFIQAAVAFFCLLGLLRAVVLRCPLELPRDICSCALAVFACWALVSTLWSMNFYDAFYAAVHWSACALAALGLAAWMRSDVWLGRLAGSFVVSGELVCAVALLQPFMGPTWIPSVRMPSAAFGNPNVLAEFLCFTIAFSAFAGWFLRRRQFLLAMLCWHSCVSGLLVLYFIRCRSAWLAIGCLVLWSASLFLKRRAGWKLFVLAAVLMLGVGGYTGYTFMTNPAFKRTIHGSANYRLIVWNNSFELFKQQPVLGHGAGSFPSVYASVLNINKADRTFDKNIQIRRAHNDFLQTAVELGLPGFLLLVFFTGGILVMALRLMSAQRTDFEQYIIFAASGSLVAFMVNASFGFPFQRALTPLLAFMSAGMIIALYCRQRAAFFCLSKRGTLIAAALGVAVAGILLLRFNLGIIESDAYYKRALAMEKRHRNVKALRYGLHALAARPGRMDVLTTVGRAYITTGRLDEGIDALQTVIKHQPYNLNALFILGVGYANAGRSAESLETFGRVLDIKPDFVEARPIVSRLKAHGRVKVNLN